MDPLNEQPPQYGPPGLPHRPFLVLFSGLMSLAMGLLLVAFGPDFVWYGVGISALSILLIGMWVRDRKPKAGEQVTPSVKYIIPGQWYLVAVMVIVVLQVCWALYLKNR